MSSASPRVVLAAPLYGQAQQLGQALTSLLGQTFSDFRLVLIDDCSPDDTVEVARELTVSDPRVELEVNERRLGMLGNTNRAWSQARERYPRAQYFALGSDHDVWSPNWLEALVDALDSHPAAVLAYPRTRRIDAAGDELSGSWRFDTEGITDPRRRLRRCLRRMVSGDMIYGLFRATALDRTGFYRPVLAPDRLLLSELALQGEFVQVPSALWSRRYVGIASLERQRRAFWPDGNVPAQARAPWWLVHTALFAQRHGATTACRDYLLPGALFQVRSRLLRARNAALVTPTLAVMRSGQGKRIVRHSILPAVREARELLDRLAQEAESR